MIFLCFDSAPHTRRHQYGGGCVAFSIPLPTDTHTHTRMQIQAHTHASHTTTERSDGWRAESSAHWYAFSCAHALVLSLSRGRSCIDRRRTAISLLFVSTNHPVACALSFAPLLSPSLLSCPPANLFTRDVAQFSVRPRDSFVETVNSFNSKTILYFMRTAKHNRSAIN